MKSFISAPRDVEARAFAYACWNDSHEPLGMTPEAVRSMTASPNRPSAEIEASETSVPLAAPQHGAESEPTLHAPEVIHSKSVSTGVPEPPKSYRNNRSPA